MGIWPKGTLFIHYTIQQLNSANPAGRGETKVFKRLSNAHQGRQYLKQIGHMSCWEHSISHHYSISYVLPNLISNLCLFLVLLPSVCPHLWSVTCVFLSLLHMCILAVLPCSSAQDHLLPSWQCLSDSKSLFAQFCKTVFFAFPCTNPHLVKQHWPFLCESASGIQSSGVW